MAEIRCRPVAAGVPTGAPITGTEAGRYRVEVWAVLTQSFGLTGILCVHQAPVGCR